MMDKAAKRAWIVVGLLFALFTIGLVMVSFWGGPYQADSAWQDKQAPSFPN